MNDLRTFLDLLNETFTAAIVIVASSMLLYNLSRNWNNPVARTSGIVLACVIGTYISEVFISLGINLDSIYRLQWLGIAYIPAATFHLSDSLLETTGLPSRGRRKRGIYALYILGTIILVLATITDTLIRPTIYDGQIVLRGESLFALYLLYFIPISMLSFNNVQRARRRCLTRGTQRRMAYLQLVMLTPSIGIFPYSSLLPPEEAVSINVLILVNLANMLITFMLLFLSYPLSFFGSRIPDRVVKVDLLRFMLRGPATGLIALNVIIYTGPTSELLFLGKPGETLLPFFVVAAILLWQWLIDIALPWLEKRLIYYEEDDEQLSKLQRLSERILTRSDMLQVIEAILESACDYLRIKQAFVAALTDGNAEFIRSVGNVYFSEEGFRNTLQDLIQTFMTENGKLQNWEGYWVIPLYSKRASEPILIGMMGVKARAEEINLDADERRVLNNLTRRAARTLDDMLLQTEVYAALEGLLPQFSTSRRWADEIEFRSSSTMQQDTSSSLNREDIINQVHAALRHYWGGPGLSSSRLLELNIVRDVLDENENNPTRALRTILQEAIENQRPEGERDFKSAEWTLYNILNLRFVENRKAKETARRLYMAEASLYRKQNVAIEAIADTLIDMEREKLADLSV